MAKLHGFQQRGSSRRQRPDREARGVSSPARNTSTNVARTAGTHRRGAMPELNRRDGHGPAGVRQALEKASLKSKTSTSSRSTRPSPRSIWPSRKNLASTARAQMLMAARSRSATRSALRGRGSSSPYCWSSSGAAGATVWQQPASAAARASRSSVSVYNEDIAAGRRSLKAAG